MKDIKSGCFILIIIVLLALIIVGACSETEEADHDDNKCDICGKTAYFSSDEEEYCRKHLADALEYYMNRD